MPFSFKKLDKAKALEVTLDTALKVLETTENALNTTPIPGAAAVITVILDVVKRQERASKNASLMAEQQERWKKLVGQLEESETDPENTSPDALSKLRDASKELARQLEDYARELREATTHEVRPRWMTCGSDEEALQDFLRKSTQAIEDYHRVQGKRIEECVLKIQRVVGAIDTKVDRIDVTVQAERDESRIREFDRLMETRQRRRMEKGPGADRVFWLKERAGFGKTAIVLSVARQAADEGTLAASFFFSYQIPELSNTSRFLPTMIYQLCLFGGAPYKQYFAAAVTKHPNLLDAKMKDQVQKLFLDPLDHPDIASPNSPIVIVIDALDECQHEDAEDLTVFITSLSLLNLPLKVFITSRPESQITAPFSDLGVEPRAIMDTSDEDVETYLRAELAKIPSKPSIRDLHLPRDWIKEEDIQSLLERAGAKAVNSDPTNAEKGLFVYIATVIRFIGDTRRCNPPKLLQIVLSTTPPLPTYHPFQVLDNLYTRVLDMALGDAEDLLQQFHAVLGGRMAVDPQIKAEPSIATLEMLLSLPQGEVRRTLVNLQSVIQSPSTDLTLPSFHHRSFTDFLTSKDRSGPRYYIDLKIHQKRLVFGCLQVIARSHLKEEVTKAMTQEEYFYYPRIKLPPKFEYASFCLPYYYESIKGDQSLLEDLETFIREHFGWWIELVPQIGSVKLYKVSDAADPQDDRQLPILFRALASSMAFYNTNTEVRVHALARKQLRRYISAVTQLQGRESRTATQALTMPIKKHIHTLRKRVDLAGGGRRKEVCFAILAFAKDAEAVIDKYHISIGNQVEVETSRKRTTFIRRQIKPLLANDYYLWLTADELEAFKREGVWTSESTSKPDHASSVDSDGDSE